MARLDHFKSEARKIHSPKRSGPACNPLLISLEIFRKRSTPPRPTQKEQLYQPNARQTGKLDPNTGEDNSTVE